MTEFLLFSLYAPLASFGEIAIGEIRRSWDRPSRSTVLGLVAAALGISRAEQEAHDVLDRAVGVAVRLDAVGSVLVDYHTTQTVVASAVRTRRPHTRAELLAAGRPGDLHSILSRREYLQNSVATIALWKRAPEGYSLAEVAGALRQPCYVLYAGRKANPLALPTAPQLVAAETLAEAFFARRLPLAEHRIARLRPPSGWGREVAHDSCGGFESGLEPLRRQVRRDTAAERRRWQFAERVVEVGLLPGSAASSSESDHP